MYFQGRFCVKPVSNLRLRILEELHASLAGGHLGYYCTLCQVQQSFFWKGMNKFIREFVAHYLICQQVKASALKPMGLLQPLPIRVANWEDLSMDFVTRLPSIKGHSVIVVVVDRLTKYCHLGTLLAGYLAAMVADYFIKQINPTPRHS